MKKYHEQLVTSVNTLPSRSYYEIQGVEKEFLAKWKFEYFPKCPSNIEDVTPTKILIVPSTWLIEGYDYHQYTNVRYPFPYDPPYIHKDNPCAVYTFDYEVNNKSDKYYLNFDGVDSCFYLYINKNFVGYSSISHRHSEFDITEYLQNDNNEIRVMVFKWCAGSYLEDQDKFRMSGIFGDVYILRRKDDHIFDFNIKSYYKNGIGKIVYKVDKEAEVTLKDGDNVLFTNKGYNDEIIIKNPHLWTAETPYLYTLIFKYNDEVIEEKVGIRTISINDNVVLLNNQLVKFKGVNRHSMTLKGYVEAKEDLINDIKLMKKHNINAIRTAHYPPHPLLPRLCDEMGIYLMVEADIECHGVVTQKGGYDQELYDELAESPMYHDQIVERNRVMYERDKNRTSILFWSL